MAVVGFSSIASLIAQRRLGESTSALARSSERLASGLRINRSSDDAAGLAVASALQAQARVFAQGYRNVNDAISALTIADGGLEQLSAITIRQKELAQQAANGSLSIAQRRSLNSEANALQREFNRITETTDFNGLRLLNGTFSQFRVQAGYGLNGSLGLGIGSNLARFVGTGQFSISQYLDTPPVGIGAGFAHTSHSLQVDFNGDGILDIVMASDDDVGLSGGVGIYIGNADGTFKAPSSGDIPSGSLSTSIAVGDLNGDGRMDVVVGGERGPTVFLQTSIGKLGAATELSDSGFQGDSVLADFNNDGKLDIASASTAGMFVRIGNGNGTFKAATTYSSSGRSLQLGDINGDGSNDLVTENGYMLGSSSGAFGAFTALVSGGTQIILADIDGNGAVDIVSDKTIRLGNNDGTFAAALTYFGAGTTAGNGLHQIQATDLNGDGITDLALSDAVGDIRSFIGNGNGTFSTGAILGANASTVLAADFNGDGVMDILAGTVDSISNDIYLGGSTTSTQIAQFNINTAQGARDAITILDTQLARITNERGAIGASQSRLQSALSTLGASTENSLAAAHRISDVDVASEAAAQTRSRILQEVGAAVLAQANLLPELALRLLRG